MGELSTRPESAARPTAITTLCFITFICAGLAVLGAAAGLSGVGTGGNPFQGAFASPNPQMARLQLEMQRDLQAVFVPWRGWLMAIGGLDVLLALLLARGGWLGWRVRPQARTWLVAAFALGLVVEGLGIVPVVDTQPATLAIMQEHMSRMALRGGELPPGFADTMQGVMRGSAVVGLVFGAAWSLAKLVFYAWGILYLSRGKGRTLGSRPQDRGAVA